MPILQQVGGADYDAPIRALQDIAPALGRLHGRIWVGDVLSRPALGLKPRQLCTVAALAALGMLRPNSVITFMGRATLVGFPQRSSRWLILVTGYAGFPAALNGISAAREIFEQRGDRPLATRHLWAAKQRLIDTNEACGPSSG